MHGDVETEVRDRGSDGDGLARNLLNWLYLRDGADVPALGTSLAMTNGACGSIVMD